MCNFGPRASVRAKYSSRLLYEWNANVTLMRTSVEENRRIGGLIAETANQCAGPAVVLLPVRGGSMLGSPRPQFWDEEAEHALLDALPAPSKQGGFVVEVGRHINHPTFSG